MRITNSERDSLFANIEAGKAVEVKAAKYKNDYCEYTFYRMDEKVFYIYYLFATTVSEGYEVTGENLEMFNIYYKEGV